MGKGNIRVYYGAGKGKTSSALGYAILEAGKGNSVIIIQFLKQKNDDEMSFISRLEPEIRLFRFQKSSEFYDDLSDSEKTDEQRNMKNGLNYARKVIQTGECAILILDEVLGLLDQNIISGEELFSLLDLKPDDMDIIMTGRVVSDAVIDYSDYVYEILTKKDQVGEVC